MTPSILHISLNRDEWMKKKNTFTLRPREIASIFILCVEHFCRLEFENPSAPSGMSLVPSTVSHCNQFHVVKDRESFSPTTPAYPTHIYFLLDKQSFSRDNFWQRPLSSSNRKNAARVNLLPRLLDIALTWSYIFMPSFCANTDNDGTVRAELSARLFDELIRFQMRACLHSEMVARKKVKQLFLHPRIVSHLSVSPTHNSKAPHHT